MFFVAKKPSSTHHISPHISPRSHHKNTTFCPQFFQNTPQKTRQKQQNPGLRRGLIFFAKTTLKKPSLLSQELPSSQQAHSPPPPELALVRRPQPAGAAHG